MGAMKELFMQYQEEMRGQDEFIDDDFHFQQWCEQKANEEIEFWNQIGVDDMFYEVPPFQPTPEEEEAAFKLFNEQRNSNEHTN
jgi:hypothetical protein